MTHTPPKGLQALLDAEPDLVDRIFEYLLAEFPQLAGNPVKYTRRKWLYALSLRAKRFTSLSEQTKSWLRMCCAFLTGAMQAKWRGGLAFTGPRCIGI